MAGSTIKMTEEGKASEKPNLLLRFFPSLMDFVFLSPILILFGIENGAHALLRDSDGGWHIRAGQWILEHRQIPNKDMFSFTKSGEPWFAWEWLWDVSAGWLHLHGGMAAIVLANLLLLCFTFALLFRLVRRKCNNDFISFGATLLAVAGSSVHWFARPHLVTLLFVVVFYSILERVRDGNKRLLLILPFLTVLWTNLHGGFGAGLILIGAYAGGELLGCIVEADMRERRAALLRSRPYLLTALACFLATFVNPYGARLHAHIFGYLTDPFYRHYITEFMSISFQNASARYFEVFVLIGAVAAYRSLYRKDYVYTLLYLGWVHLALTSGRHIPIFVIVAAPFVAQSLEELVGALGRAHVSERLHRIITAFESAGSEFAKTDRIPRFHVTSAVGILIVAALLYASSPPPNFRAEFDPEKFPADAAGFLAGPEFSQGLFTTDQWSGYLIYRLYPATKVFIDGRSDFYGPKYVEKYLDVLNAKNGWEKYLDQYHIHAILLPLDATLVGILKESKRWSTAYKDDIAVVFRRVSSTEQ